MNFSFHVYNKEHLKSQVRIAKPERVYRRWKQLQGLKSGAQFTIALNFNGQQGRRFWL